MKINVFLISVAVVLLVAGADACDKSLIETCNKLWLEYQPLQTNQHPHDTFKDWFCGTEMKKMETCVQKLRGPCEKDPDLTKSTFFRRTEHNFLVWKFLCSGPGHLPRGFQDNWKCIRDSYKAGDFKKCCHGAGLDRLSPTESTEKHCIKFGLASDCQYKILVEKCDKPARHASRASNPFGAFFPYESAKAAGERYFEVTPAADVIGTSNYGVCKEKYQCSEDDFQYIKGHYCPMQELDRCNMIWTNLQPKRNIFCSQQLDEYRHCLDSLKSSCRKNPINRKWRMYRILENQQEMWEEICVHESFMDLFFPNSKCILDTYRQGLWVHCADKCGLLAGPSDRECERVGNATTCHAEVLRHSCNDASADFMATMHYRATDQFCRKEDFPYVMQHGEVEKCGFDEMKKLYEDLNSKLARDINDFCRRNLSFYSAQMKPINHTCTYYRNAEYWSSYRKYQVFFDIWWYRCSPDVKPAYVANRECMEKVARSNIPQVCKQQYGIDRLKPDSTIEEHCHAWGAFACCSYNATPGGVMHECGHKAADIWAWSYFNASKDMYNCSFRDFPCVEDPATTCNMEKLKKCDSIWRNFQIGPHTGMRHAQSRRDYKFCSEGAMEYRKCVIATRERCEFYWDLQRSTFWRRMYHSLQIWSNLCMFKSIPKAFLEKADCIRKDYQDHVFEKCTDVAGLSQLSPRAPNATHCKMFGNASWCHFNAMKVSCNLSAADIIGTQHYLACHEVYGCNISDFKYLDEQYCPLKDLIECGELWKLFSHDGSTFCHEQLKDYEKCLEKLKYGCEHIKVFSKRALYYMFVIGARVWRQICSHQSFYDVFSPHSACIKKADADEWLHCAVKGGLDPPFTDSPFTKEIGLRAAQHPSRFCEGIGKTTECFARIVRQRCGSPANADMLSSMTYRASEPFNCTIIDFEYVQDHGVVDACSESQLDMLYKKLLQELQTDFETFCSNNMTMYKLAMNPLKHTCHWYRNEDAWRIYRSYEVFQHIWTYRCSPSVQPVYLKNRDCIERVAKSHVPSTCRTLYGLDHLGPHTKPQEHCSAWGGYACCVHNFENDGMLYSCKKEAADVWLIGYYLAAREMYGCHFKDFPCQKPAKGSMRFCEV